MTFQDFVNALYGLGGAEEVNPKPEDPHSIYGKTARTKHFTGGHPESEHFLKQQSNDVRKFAENVAHQTAAFQSQQALNYPQYRGSENPIRINAADKGVRKPLSVELPSKNGLDVPEGYSNWDGGLWRQDDGGPLRPGETRENTAVGPLILLTPPTPNGGRDPFKPVAGMTRTDNSDPDPFGIGNAKERRESAVKKKRSSMATSGLRANQIKDFSSKITKGSKK